MKAAAKAADDAAFPAEVPDVNFADEFDKAIDEALGLPVKTPDDSSALDQVQ